MASSSGQEEGLFDESGTLIRPLSSLTNLKSRGEPVFRDTKSGLVYKVFNRDPKKAGKDDPSGIWFAAQEADVNVPAGLEVQRGERREKNKNGVLTKKPVYILQTRFVEGRFFQLSKGHEKMVMNEVLATKNEEVIKKTIRDLCNAYRFGLTDVQGFITGNGAELIFIDIHRNSNGPGSIDTLSLARKINEGLETLKFTPFTSIKDDGEIEE